MKYAPFDPIVDSLQSFFRGFVMPAPSPYTLDRKQTLITVANTVTETSVYSFTVPAFTVGQDQALRVRVTGDMLNNQATARTFTWRIKLGVTTLWGSAVLNLSAAVATRRVWVIDVLISNINATNVQALIGLILTGSPTAPTIAGVGDGIGGSVGVIYGDSAIDMTADALLDVTVQMGNANALADMRMKSALLEVV